MSTVFGESGPKNVQVLSHPTRRPSKTGPPGAAVTDGGRRMSLDSEMAAAEAGDHFPAPSQVPLGQTWPTVQRPLSTTSSSSGSTVSLDILFVLLEGFTRGSIFGGIVAGRFLFWSCVRSVGFDRAVVAPFARPFLSRKLSRNFSFFFFFSCDRNLFF